MFMQKIMKVCKDYCSCYLNQMSCTKLCPCQGRECANQRFCDIDDENEDDDEGSNDEV